MDDLPLNDNKIKNLISFKKNYIQKKKSLTKEILEYKKQKNKLLEELKEINNKLKKSIEDKNILTIKINNLNIILKQKKKKGKRGKCLSGLTVNIKSRIPQNIQDFFNITEQPTITRVMMMKSIQQYITENNLYIENDKRYVSLENKPIKLDNLMNIMKVDINESKFRIQRFRTYIEKILI